MKRKPLMLLALLVLWSGLSASEILQTNHGVCSPVSIGSSADGERVFVGSVRSGFWKTENAGQTWEQINENMVQAELYRAVEHMMEVVDPAADTVLTCLIRKYPSEWSKTEYHTLDGGQTWSSFDPYTTWPDTIPQYFPQGRLPATILRERPGKAYVAAQFGFSILENAEWSYTDLSQMHTGLFGMHVDQSDPETIYLWGSWGLNIHQESIGGAIRSTDSGVTWERLTPMQDLTTEESGFVLKLEVVSPDTLAALVHWHMGINDHPPVLLSFDGGESWQWCSEDGLPTAATTNALLAVPERPGRLIMGFGPKSGLWESNDYGQTWERVFRGLPTQASLSWDFYRNPYSGILFICYAELGIFRSDDYGDSWYAVNPPPLGVQTDSYEGLQVYEGGVLQNTQRDNVYFALYESTEFAQVEAPSNDQVYWDTSIHLGNERFLISRIRSNMMPNPTPDVINHLSVGQSYDAGQTWAFTPEREFDPGLSPYLMNLLDDSVLVASTGNGTLVQRSYDFGETWEDISDRGRIYDKQVIDGKLYALRANPNDIVHSDDYGSSWRHLSFPDHAALEGAFIRCLGLNDTIYVRVRGDAWAYTEAEGWEIRGEISDDFLDQSIMPWDIVAGPADTFMVAGSQEKHHLWVSYDMGWTWEEQEIEVAGYVGEHCNELRYDRWRDRLWIDTGMGLAYMDDPTLAVGEALWVAQPAGHLVWDCYPNPFNDRVTVRYTLTRPSEVRVRVVDLLGRQVADLVDASQPAGAYTVPFVADGLSSGSYFVQLVAANETHQRRITLLK